MFLKGYVTALERKDKMNEIEKRYNMFENIKHVDEEGKEYWEGRELQKV